MAKDTQNAHIFDMAEVWIADDLEAPNPQPGEEFGDGWNEVGLMDGDDGFSTAREEDRNKLWAWGDILVRQSRRRFALTRNFSVLEDNETTRRLIWPGSSATQIVRPRPEPIKMAFVKRDGDQEIREITARYAEVDVNGDITENETDLAKVQLTAEIYPRIDGDENVYFDVQRDGIGEAGGGSGEG